jgi:hypothetical protein
MAQKCRFSQASRVPSPRPRPTACQTVVRSALRKTARFPTARRCEKRHIVFGVLSLCLSRACLGKMIVFRYKWRKNAVFRRSFSSSILCGLTGRTLAWSRASKYENAILAPFLNSKCIILPRQARDKHRESTQKRVMARFLTGDGHGGGRGLCN